VLAVGQLAPEDRRLFDELELGAASLTPEELGPTLLEPHPSWMTRIEAEWQTRYSR
jgi:putative thiamine transport system substrate-binding protein